MAVAIKKRNYRTVRKPVFTRQKPIASAAGTSLVVCYCWSLSSTNFRFGFLSESSLRQTSLEHRAFRARLVSHDSACQNRYWASLVQLVNVHPLSVGLTNLVAAAAK